MAEFKHLSWLLIWTYLTCVCNCQDSIVSVIQRLDQFEEDLFYNKEDMIKMEKRIRNIIVGSKTALRAELRENIRDQVREAMAEILEGESLQNMVKSQVVSELRHLKQGYHQMKRQMHHVSNELKDFQDETSVFHETVLKKAWVGNRENSTDVCVRDKHRLEIELQKCDVTTADLKADIKRLMTLNETCQFPKQKQKTTFTVHDASPATQNDTSTSGSPGLTTLMTTPRLPVSTTSVNTQRRQEERSRIRNRENSRDVCVRDKHKLEIVLQKCDIYAADLKADNERFIEMNNAYQFQISQLKTALAVPASSPTIQYLSSTTMDPVSTTSVTTPRPPVSTTSATTPRQPVSTRSVKTPTQPVSTTSVTTPTLPVSKTSVTTSRREEDKSRILIAPRWLGTHHQFRQLNIHSNSLSMLQNHNMNWVTSLAYVAKTNKLLIGSKNPYKIASSTLDRSHVTVLRKGVLTYGMAVDEDRNFVFIATYKPQYTISRMSTKGKDFTTIVDLSKYVGIPRQLTLDTRRKRIYGSNGGKLFMVTYDGQGLATLATGSVMFAVTLDQTAGVLYYNNDEKLMKMTVSNNVSTEVTTLTARPWNMILYRGTIYYSSLSSQIVGAVNVAYNTSAYTLKSVGMDGVSLILLCLVP